MRSEAERRADFLAMLADVLETPNLAYGDDIRRKKKLRELKERYKEIQTYWEGNPYDEIYKLCDENDWLLHNSVVNEYLRAESALSRLIRRMMDEVTADLVVDFE